MWISSVSASPQPRSAALLASPWGVLLAAFLLQLPLSLNPGYFSHDELQWAHFAQAGVQVPWLDATTFQHRPLTFNLWMLLSRALFDTPMLFHAVLVAWGSANASLLYAVGRRFGMQTWPALFGALVFALSPYAVYTHGWVGCIADLIWLSCALLLAWGVQRIERAFAVAVLASVLTAIALLGKEAAFAIPPLLGVAWLFDGRKSKWLLAMLASGLVAAAYLGLRLDALLDAPREGAQYSLSVLHAPLRWLEYQLFPPIVPLVETFTTLQRPLPAMIASVLWLGLLAACWQASPRLATLFLLGGIAALLPVLPLATSFNHYAYGFAAITTMTLAAAWPQASRWGRIAMTAFALLTVLHGAAVMWRMQQVGRMQAVFSPALAAAVARDADVVLLQLSPDTTEWVIRRLTHDIPSYAGVVIGTRVRIVEPGQPAEFIVQPDGSLQPVR